MGIPVFPKTTHASGTDKVNEIRERCWVIGDRMRAAAMWMLQVIFGKTVPFVYGWRLLLTDSEEGIKIRNFVDEDGSSAFDRESLIITILIIEYIQK